MKSKSQPQPFQDIDDNDDGDDGDGLVDDEGEDAIARAASKFVTPTLPKASTLTMEQACHSSCRRSECLAVCLAVCLAAAAEGRGLGG